MTTTTTQHNSQCIVCNVRYKVHYNNDSMSISKVKMRSQIFNTFLSYLLTNSNNSLLKNSSSETLFDGQFNFDREPIPFCPKCKADLSSLCLLDNQLTRIQHQISRLVTNFAATITQSHHNNEEEKKENLDHQKISDCHRILRQHFSPKVILLDFKIQNHQTGQDQDAHDDDASIHVADQDDHKSSVEESQHFYQHGDDLRSTGQQCGKDDEDVANGSIKEEEDSVEIKYRLTERDQLGDDHITLDTLSDNDDNEQRQNEITGPQNMTRLEEVENGKFLYMKRWGFQQLQNRDGRVKVGNAGFGCDTCGKKLSTKLRMVVHVRSKHADTHRFVCETCGKGFYFKDKFDTHKLIHMTDRPILMCATCGQTFKYKCTLNAHEKAEHSTDDPALTCHFADCGKKFTANKALAKHTQDHHQDKPYLCLQCGKRFREKRFMKGHVRRHGHAGVEGHL